MDEAGVAALDPARMIDKVEPIMETVRLVRSGLVDEGYGETTLIGFAGAPFTLACYAIEGGGYFVMDSLAGAVPDWFLSLLTIILPARWLFALRRRRRQVRLGLCSSCGYDLRAIGIRSGRDTRLPPEVLYKLSGTPARRVKEQCHPAPARRRRAARQGSA